MNECKCSECFAEPVCADDEFPIAACCEEMRQMIRVVRNHFADADKMVRWISVEERLPETRVALLGQRSKKVIVAFHYDDGTHGTDTAHMSNEKWVFEDGIYVVKRTVTHWMPLPEPPKGVE